MKTNELQEELKVFYLNRNNLVLGYYSLAKYGISAWDIRLMLSTALKDYASTIVVIHNHPNSNVNPSKSDWNLTEKIQQACK